MLTTPRRSPVADAATQLKVTVTNECGHKLPTGYPEGRRVWLNVKFYDEAMNPLGESGAYDPTNGVLTRDADAKIYEIHPGLETNLAARARPAAGTVAPLRVEQPDLRGQPHPAARLHQRASRAFGGAPVGHAYADGQYWDDTLYNLPAGATRAEVRLYYQSTSKEFVEFLRDENLHDSQGQDLYDLWNNNGKCPPTLMSETVWLPAFVYQSANFTAQGRLQIHFLSRPGMIYTIEYTEDLAGSPVWHVFQNNGTFTATNTVSFFEDDFTANTSGGPAASGARSIDSSTNPVP